MITIYNIDQLHSEGFSLIEKRLVRGTNTKPKYQLLKSLKVQLSNGDVIEIPKGFIWDLSSVPRLFWWLLPPDGDFDLAYLIHDYLWLNKDNFEYSQKFTDDEMYVWAKKINGTEKISLRNIDNFLRYWFVRKLGWLVWKNYIKIK